MTSFEKIRAEILAELNYDWVPVCEVVGIINREFGLEPVDVVAPETAAMLELLVADRVMVPGSFNLDPRFVPWGDTTEEQIRELRVRLKIGDNIGLGLERYFDLPGEDSHQVLTDKLAREKDNSAKSK